MHVLELRCLIILILLFHQEAQGNIQESPSPLLHFFFTATL